MAHLTKNLLEALRKEFPILCGVNFNIHTTYRPVKFQVKRELPPDTVWKLELGRYNNDPTWDYHQGVTSVHLWNSSGNGHCQIDLDEGETRAADLLRDGDLWVLERYSWCSQLVQNEPGSVTYTLYKNATQARAKAVEEAARTVVQMSAELRE